MADSFKELVLESKEFASQRRPLSFGRAAGDSALNVFEDLGSSWKFSFKHQQC